MFCMKCGASLPGTAKYCNQCGEKISDCLPDEATPLPDPYWDNVLPEIDEEINQISKDIISRSIGVVVALFIIIIWLIFFT